MRQVIRYIAASPDGYIARPNGGTGWLHRLAARENVFAESQGFGYSALLESIATTLMAHSTYQIILGVDAPLPTPITPTTCSAAAPP